MTALKAHRFEDSARHHKLCRWCGAYAWEGIHAPEFNGTIVQALSAPDRPNRFDAWLDWLRADHIPTTA